MKSKYTGLDISMIEAKVPEEISLKAEEVLDKGSVSGLTRIKKNHWEAIVIDNNIHFSTLLEIKAERLHSSTCNCNTYAQEGMCSHILASIFDIRKKIEEKKDLKKVRSNQYKSKGIDSSVLLSSLTKEETDQFILSKIKSDKNFKLLFQGRFIEKLLPDQIVPFIESTFPVLTKADEKIASSKLKTFLDTSEELINHFKQLISKESFTEAYQIAFFHLKKSFYIKYHLNREHSRFLKLHKSLLSNYIEIYKLIEAPEYKLNINKQLEELMGTSYISASLHEEKNLWMILYSSSGQRDNLRRIVQSLLTRDHDHDYSSYYFIRMLELILAEQKGDKIEIIKQKDIQESYRIVQYLNQYKTHEACQEAMYMFYLTKTIKHPLAKLIIENIELHPSYLKEVLEKTIQYYLLYKSNDYLFFLQKISPDWERTKSSLINTIKNKNDTPLLMSLYLQCGDIEDGLATLRANLSWNLIRSFDKVIANHSTEECQELYYQLLEDYLKDHFGINAQDFTQDVFHRICSIGYKPWLKSLKDRLKKKFPDRKALFH